MANIPERAGKAARAIATAHDIALEQVIVYGSHARGTAGVRDRYCSNCR